MKSLLRVVLAALSLAVPTAASAQNDTASIRRSFDEFRTIWREAWSRRDVPALGKLVTEDIDWVAADGTWLKGREAFERHHARLFAVQFASAQWKLLDERIEIVDQNLGITIQATQISGDTFANGESRPPRSSVGTRIIVRQNGRWRLKTSHNTMITSPPPK
jgi:uncharacterized protein (TIGR02246 family)